MATTPIKNIWRPNPGPQSFALSLPNNTFEILYGGARGGGKTDAGLVWIGEHQANPLYRALVIRRNADDLSDWIDRARVMYPHASVAYRPAVITFPSGAIIRTGHLKDEGAYTKYVGHEYHRMLIEELTQIPTEKRYIQLISSCRSTVPSLSPQVFATTNPGSIGHMWVKERFIDFAPPMTRKADPISGRLRIYIPAKIDDNPALMDNDAAYVHSMEALRSTDEDLYKAWRLGDWNIFIGQVFHEWRPSKHVIDKVPYDLKDFDTFPKFVGFDWGFNDPACAIWIAVAPENEYGVKHLIAYREIYQNQVTADQWAKELAAIIEDEPVEGVVMPHDTYSRLGGNNTIASVFDNHSLPLIPADNKSHAAKMSRIAFMHQVLSDAPDGEPYLQVLRNCTNFIRTLPALPYHENKAEEIADGVEDHAFDAMTYDLMVIDDVYGGLVVDTSLPERQVKHTPYKGNPDGTITSEPIDIGKILNEPNERDWRST